MIKTILFSTLIILSISACVTLRDDKDSFEKEMLVEAESAELSDGLRLSEQDGKTVVSGFSSQEWLEFTVNARVSIQCLLSINLMVESGSGAQTVEISNNGNRIDRISCADNGTWIETESLKFRLFPGENRITIKSDGMGILMDSIYLKDANDLTAYFDVSTPLVTPEPMDSAVKLYNYLQSIYGEYTLTGQQDWTWNSTVSMNQRVYSDVQKYPAIAGFDFLDFNRGGQGSQLQVEEAINWWYNAAGTGKNGIVAFCWHWRSPSDRHESQGFYSDKTDFRIPYDSNTDSWKVDSLEYQEMMADIDLIAEELQTLEAMGVPILWRPLHEASGGWFWWGATGAKPYKALWNLLFEKLTYEYELTNLIWVWNGQDKYWYPGDETVDIIGYDVYAQAKSRDSALSYFLDMVKVPEENKMVAMSENGVMPDPEMMEAHQARWLYFITWNDGSTSSAANSSNFWAGGYHNTLEHKERVYQSPIMLTLDELPLFTE